MNEKYATKIVNSTNMFPWKMRKNIYTKVGLVRRGGQFDIRKGVYFDHIKSVKLGNNVMINQNVQFHIGDNPDTCIHISDNVFIGMNTCFICVSHMVGDAERRAGKNIYRDIEVGKGTWIGANVVVLPGVSIGNGCVIAAGSVVITDCEDNYLYAGNPAKKKRFLDI